MAKDDRVRMPSSMAGITQYYDESTSHIVMSPKQVIILIVLVIVIVVAFHAFSG